MPVLAQITGAVALTALLVGPWWSRIPQPLPASVLPSSAQPMVAFPKPAAPIRPMAPESSTRPAHLNLDVQHAFRSVNLSVSVDGSPALETTLAGSGKRFKVFGKRAARSFTRTIDLDPGAHIINIRLQSTADKFDQSRVERFDLAPASVASMQIIADKAGLTLVAERPPAPTDSGELKRAGTEAASPAPVPAPAQATQVPAAAPVPTPAATVKADAAGELLQSLRSMLIAIAGFVASAATGFIVQEFLRTRRRMFAETDGGANPKRRRAGFAG